MQTVQRTQRQTWHLYPLTVIPIHIQTPTHTPVHPPTRTHTHPHQYTPTHTHQYTPVHPPTRTHTHPHQYTHTHTHQYTHTHTSTPPHTHQYTHTTHQNSCSNTHRFQQLTAAHSDGETGMYPLGMKLPQLKVKELLLVLKCLRSSCKSRI